MRSNYRLGITFIALFALLTIAEPANASPGFADTIYVGDVRISGTPCPTVTLATLPVTVNTSSRVDGYGAGVYRQNGSDLQTVSLHLQLDDATGSTVAVSNSVPLSAYFTVNNNGAMFGAVSGVLYAGSDPDVVSGGGGMPFVADPGAYTLKLILRPTLSPCPQQSVMTFNTLSYLLADTAP